MAKIDPYVNEIRNAVYGEEVRGSIINALEKVNDDNESYIDLKNEVVAAKDRTVQAEGNAAGSAELAGQRAASIEGDVEQAQTAAQAATTDADRAEAARDAAEEYISMVDPDKLVSDIIPGSNIQVDNTNPNKPKISVIGDTIKRYDCIKQGNTFVLTSDEDAGVLIFRAPATHSQGDTFSVNGATCQAVSMDGYALHTGAFVAGSIVTCIREESFLVFQFAQPFTEIGNFAPRLAGSTTAGGFTYSTQTGTYTVQGNSCKIYSNISITACNTSPTGGLIIAGLPFAASQTAIGLTGNVVGKGTSPTDDLIRRIHKGKITAGSSSVSLFQQLISGTLVSSGGTVASTYYPNTGSVSDTIEFSIEYAIPNITQQITAQVAHTLTGTTGTGGQHETSIVRLDIGDTEASVLTMNDGINCREALETGDWNRAEELLAQTQLDALESTIWTSEAIRAHELQLKNNIIEEC